MEGHAPQNLQEKKKKINAGTWHQSQNIPVVVYFSYYTGWPRKNATPTINDFKKTRDKINKHAVCIIA